MIRRVLFLFFAISLSLISYGVSPYFYFGQLHVSSEKANQQLQELIAQNGFDLLGQYHPENNADLTVLAFTNDDIKKITFGVKDRGALASVLKIALVNQQGKTNLYLLNPEYIFQAYLRKEMDKSSIKLPLLKATDKIKDALELYATIPNGVGGNIDQDDLRSYRYMFGMERFSNPVELNEFTSFQQGVKTITANANNGKADTKLIYQLIDESSQTAVFGIGLLNKEKGEPHFLPIIGEDHAAAMPYEIILQGKTATMLHGRYRIALHWPELTMVTFSKIMSTPGEIEDQLKALTEN